MSRQICPCGHEKFGYKIDSDTAIKSVEGSKHRLRTPAGWGIQKDVFEAHRETVMFWRIHDKEEGRDYWATTKQIAAHATEIDRGFGVQLVLTLSHWSKTAPSIQPELF